MRYTKDMVETQMKNIKLVSYDRVKLLHKHVRSKADCLKYNLDQLGWTADQKDRYNDLDEIANMLWKCLGENEN